jgi:circadian clock protein KaiC
LIATLQENPSQLERVAQGFGWTLSNDGVHTLYRSPVDLYIDEWVYNLLRAAERTNSRRVLIDSLSDIAFAVEDEQRFREYIYSLIQRLSRQGISLFMTSELPDVFGVAGVTPAGAGSLCDNIILLQYTTRHDAVRRTLTVLKTRASKHHEQVRDYEIGRRGITFTAP